MSAITVTPDHALSDLGPDGIRRYKTRCKILVDSHNSGTVTGDKNTILLMEDVTSVEMSKTIKGVGNATISLIPSQNWLNLIFPNDYVNIYFDIGDGTGWTRTFFGMVDRIDESYTVTSTGTPHTAYRIVCSDFMKAFDKTQIYFNPHMKGRRDFQDFDFASGNIGGLSLMSRGVVVGGAPSDIIENVILLLLGFSTQFTLPPSYNPGDTQKRLRQKRVELVRGRLSNEAKEALAAAGNSYKRLRNKAQEKATSTWNSAARSVNREERIADVATAYGVPIGQFDNKTDEQIIQVLTTYDTNQQLAKGDSVGQLTGTTEAGIAGDSAILASAESEDSALIDVVDTFSFVERRAMDGFLFGQPVWQAQGSLASILQSFSNESVNELFWDLRPLSATSDGVGLSDEIVQGAYATIPDDKGGNVDHTGNEQTGITHIPAVIMREYPFSTIDSVNLEGIQLSIKDAEGNKEEVGVLTFGDLFNRYPNAPGRRMVYVDNMNLSENYNGKSKDRGAKHLDVAVVQDREIISTSLGRSDNDHFNLFEFYSNALLGTDMKFFLNDVLPIVTPIHILRNGLRVRSVTTTAARFSVDSVINVKKPVPDPDDAEGADSKDLVSTGQIGSPVNSPDEVTFSKGQPLSNWNYRLKKPLDPATNKPTTDSSQWYWRWHNGIDITRKAGRVDPPDTKIPIYAIADGEVVISAPIGCYRLYGNTVVIKHKFDGIDTPRYSVYAHLSKRAVGWGTDKNIEGSWGKRHLYAAKGMTGLAAPGRQTAKPVKKGSIIGYMGHSGTKNSRDHLHFEIDKHFPPFAKMQTAYTPDKPFSAYPFQPTMEGLTSIDAAKAINGTLMPDVFYSCDPVEFYSSLGEDLSDLINQGTTDVDEGGEDETESPGNEEDAPDANQNREEEGTVDDTEEVKEASTKTVNKQHVDHPTSRRQVIRWALLQDHWYQHNLEYLSGNVTMRGAPEIRVGYRLDLFDRDMSFYVEGVNHSWQFPNNMKTSISVTRGQPNNPYPIYVLPYIDSMGPTSSQRRTSASRLGAYFVTPDPIAIRRSLVLRSGATTESGTGDDFNIGISGYGTKAQGNLTDQLEAIEFDSKTSFSEKYNEVVVPAGKTETTEPDLPTTDPTDSARQDGVAGVPEGASINKDNPAELQKVLVRLGIKEE